MGIEMVSVYSAVPLALAYDVRRLSWDLADS